MVLRYGLYQRESLK